MHERQTKTVNQVMCQMNEISECAGKISGISMVLRSTVGNKKTKIDTDYICGQLLDIVDCMESSLSNLRQTLLPIEDEE